SLDATSLYPYTTLFRSRAHPHRARGERSAHLEAGARGAGAQRPSAGQHLRDHRRERPEGPRAVRDRVLLLRRQLGVAAVESVRLEQRVVAEPAVADGLGQQPAAHDALTDLLAAVRGDER